MDSRFVASLLISIIVVTSILPSAHADIGSDIKNYITNGLSDLINKLTGGINYNNNGNIFNTTQQETDDLTRIGGNLLSDFFNIFIDLKDFAGSGVKFISPFEMNEMLITVVALAFAVIFIVRIIGKIGKDLLYLLIIGLAIVAIFVAFKINS